jgi:hypothetical protein
MNPVNSLKRTTLALAAAAALALPLLTAPGAANAGSLENLERERAILIETLLSSDLPAQERHTRVAVARTRLIDLERLVLRDKDLVGKNTPAVRAAFENYDLTFLVHAATEKNRALSDHWLTEVGVSTQAVMNARMGRR